MHARSRSNRLYVTALVTAAALAAQTPAHAADSVAVSYLDLDLSQPAGISTLHGRLRAAARTVCGAPERGEARAYFARRDCARQAVAQALRDLEASPRRVAALHR
jgi:UrcA family protein